jgi:diaminohydroxyphosphoribosylaminopyrimidine deaminase/5-amino-6-(5-phosphoribosylamino)uracil reductase
VISALDPNPLVFKKSLQRIKKAGIEVSVGLLERKNSFLNETYIKYITQKSPFVIAKAAISLDGKIATQNYSSQWISSKESREYIHLLRGECDSLMVGINTIIRDDPLLTVRHPNWKGKKITRIILDSHLRFPLKAKILSTSDHGKILVFTLKHFSESKQEALNRKGVEVIPLSFSPSRILLNEVFSILAKREITSVLAEGGGKLLTSILGERLADKIFITISPKLIGGRTAPSFFQGEGVSLIKDALHAKRINSFQIDEDILVEVYL